MSFIVLVSVVQWNIVFCTCVLLGDAYKLYKYGWCFWVRSAVFTMLLRILTLFLRKRTFLLGLIQNNILWHWNWKNLSKVDQIQPQKCTNLQQKLLSSLKFFLVFSAVQKNNQGRNSNSKRLHPEFFYLWLHPEVTKMESYLFVVIVVWIQWWC